LRKLTSVLVFLALALALAAPSYAAKPTITAPCVQCHEGAADVVRGTLVAVSEKFRTIQVAVGKIVWVIRYDETLKLSGAESLSAIPKEKEIAVAYTGPEKSPAAVSLSVKPPYKLPPEKVLSVEEMVGLLEKGPEEGGYVLLDARPKPRYDEGHIPHALPFPFPAFDQLKDKMLPGDKGKLVIFYCGGET
jgi:hypothetical protein